jgi:uncharacterized membrane protein (UPF0182 family)
VLVSYGNEVAANTTLARSLADLFGAPPPATPETPAEPEEGETPEATPSPSPGTSTPPAGPTDVVSLVQQAEQAFSDGEAALRAGDFAAYGQAQERLRQALDQLAATSGGGAGAASPAPSPSPAG